MKPTLFFNKHIILILVIVSIFVLSILIYFVSLLSHKTTVIQNTLSTPSPTPRKTQAELLPTYPKEKGGGVNLEDPRISVSLQEIKKLSPYLPYTTTLKTSVGPVSIVIPGPESQTTSWTLLINIFDIDYGIPPSDPEFPKTKKSFLESVKAVRTWITEKGADPEKIIFVWGDRELIQLRSEEWLK